MTDVISLPGKLYGQLDAVWRRAPEVDFDIWLECEVEALLHLWDARWLCPLTPCAEWHDVPVSPEVAYTLNGIAIAERRAFEVVCAAIAVQVLERAHPGRQDAAEPAAV